MPSIITGGMYPDEAYVRLDIDWTDYPAVTHARVIRTNTVTGEQVMLRPYGDWDADGNIRLTCGLGILWDTEPPLDVDLVYRTEAADAPLNTAVNSSFEGSVLGWTVFGGTFASSATFAHAGVNSGLLTPNGINFGPTISQANVPVVPGIDATISLWVLTPQGWNSVQLQVRYFTAAGTQTGPTFKGPIEILDDAEWRFMRLQPGAVPDDAATATISFLVTGTPPNTVLFYLDQFEFNQLRPVTAYAEDDAEVFGHRPFYLKDPLNPCHDRALERCVSVPDQCNPAPGMMVLDYGRSETLEPNAVTLQPINDEYPLTVSRRRRAPSALVLRIITRTFADRDALKETLAPGTVLFFQAPPEYGVSDRYIDVGPATIDAPIKDLRLQPRFFVLPHGLRRRPEGPANGVCGARIRDLCDLYASWGAITIAGLTWTEIMLGEASPYGPGQDITGFRTWDGVNAEFASFNAVNTGGRTFDDLLEGA